MRGLLFTVIIGPAHGFVNCAQLHFVAIFRECSLCLSPILQILFKKA